MNNLLSYCGLVDSTISASEKDLPVQNKFLIYEPRLVTHFFTNSKFRKICCSKKFIISEHPSVAMNEIDDSLLFQFPDKNQVIQNSSSKTIYDFSSVILFMSLSYTLII